MYAGGITPASNNNINSTKEDSDDSPLRQDDFSSDVYVDTNDEEMLMPSILQMGIAKPVNKIGAATNFKPTVFGWFLKCSQEGKSICPRRYDCSHTNHNKQRIWKGQETSQSLRQNGM
jgi:hypothetical protein